MGASIKLISISERDHPLSGWMGNIICVDDAPVLKIIIIQCLNDPF